MKCERLNEWFADHLAGRLGQDQQVELESHLQACQACQEEVRSLRELWSKLASLPTEQPSPASQARFQTMLAAYRAGMEQAESPSSPSRAISDWLARLWPRQPVLQFALLLILFAGGVLLGSALRLDRPDTRNVPGGQDLAIHQLREEISNMKQLVMISLLQQPSASERLRGVEWSYRLEQPDEPIIAALLRALDSDSNVNVRLAAIEALERFASHGRVRIGLLDSLARQSSPLVQIEMINLMVGWEERDSIPMLRSLLQQPDLDPIVRERAEWGLRQLI